MLSKPIRPQEQYYDEFSKYVLKEASKKETMNTDNFTKISWRDYFLSCREKTTSPKQNLLKLKQPNLKWIAKTNKLHVSGTKPELVERISAYFIKNIKAMKIQSIYRRHIVYRYIKIHGPIWLKNREKCVNESDFTTLDPLNEIPDERFFSYEDKSGFIYGFDIVSLIRAFKMTNKIVNPYTREEISYKTTKNIFALFKTLKLLFPAVVEEIDFTIQTARSSPRNPSLIRRIELEQKMRTLREKTIQQRIYEIFMTLDELGNYTDVRWFLSLSKGDLSFFYFSFATWWSYRANISAEVRRAICYLENPFEEMQELSNYRAISFERYQQSCVSLIEYMIHSGIDIEHRKLGALHVLTVLTIVSQGARESFPWLYEMING